MFRQVQWQKGHAIESMSQPWRIHFGQPAVFGAQRVRRLFALRAAAITLAVMLVLWLHRAVMAELFKATVVFGMALFDQCANGVQPSVRRRGHAPQSESNDGTENVSHDSDLLFSDEREALISSAINRSTLF
jgi:hypothetical protein